MTVRLSKKAGTKTGYKIHLAGRYLDFRIVFTHSFEHEIPNLVYNLGQLENGIWLYSESCPQEKAGQDKNANIWGENVANISIQWGAIGGVGVLARSSAKASGSVSSILPQVIDS